MEFQEESFFCQLYFPNAVPQRSAGKSGQQKLCQLSQLSAPKNRKCIRNNCVFMSKLAGGMKCERGPGNR